MTSPCANSADFYHYCNIRFFFRIISQSAIPQISVITTITRIFHLFHNLMEIHTPRTSDHKMANMTSFTFYFRTRIGLSLFKTLKYIIIYVTAARAEMDQCVWFSGGEAQTEQFIPNPGNWSPAESRLKLRAPSFAQGRKFLSCCRAEQTDECQWSFTLTPSALALHWRCFSSLQEHTRSVPDQAYSMNMQIPAAPVTERDIRF